MNKKNVYTCETCSALYVCLKYFQEHRKKHANQEGRTIFPCTHCQQVHNSEHESHLHSHTHKNEPPHRCEVCQEILGISEEEIRGSRRSIGTTTDFHTFNISLDKPMISGEDNDDGEVDDEEEEDDDDEEDDDEDDEDEDEDDDDDGVEDEVDEEADSSDAVKLAIKHETRQTTTPQNNNNNNINNNGSNNNKPSRPSRSTGKGKGNRKARFTMDGDFKRKFSCSHCGKSFKTKSHLQRHILTHTGEKPYHCNVCQTRFNQSSSLRNHVIAIHTKEFPHFCNTCGKGFLMPAVLHKHLQTGQCGKVSDQIVNIQ